MTQQEMVDYWQSRATKANQDKSFCLKNEDPYGAAKFQIIENEAKVVLSQLMDLEFDPPAVKCPECDNPYPHLCTDGSYFCDECDFEWGEAIIDLDPEFQKIVDNHFFELL